MRNFQSNLRSDVHFAEYNVLLSYPDYDRPNTVQVVDSDGYVSYTSEGVSKVILPDEQGAAGERYLHPLM